MADGGSRLQLLELGIWEPVLGQELVPAPVQVAAAHFLRHQSARPHLLLPSLPTPPMVLYRQLASLTITKIKPKLVPQKQQIKPKLVPQELPTKPKLVPQELPTKLREALERVPELVQARDLDAKS
jgi:hypothetical protein